MPPDTLPETSAIAFKEWAGVCAAIASGRQSLILRKGGIAEGSGGFKPEHPLFWLYPTYVHEAEQGLKAAPPINPPNDATTVLIDTLVVVESVARVDDLATILALDDLHIWTEETVRKRFNYRTPGLWVLGVRAYRQPDPWVVAITPAQLGCKTWVPLDAPLSTADLVPARSEPEAATDRARLAKILGEGLAS
jgi:hypothetical protein